MAKPALGTKRICTGCAAKFYDLGKDPIICPTCETVYAVPKPASRGARSGYAPGSVYDPKAEPIPAMGTLKEAPGVADDTQEKEDAEVAGIEDIEPGEAADTGVVPMLEELDEN